MSVPDTIDLPMASAPAPAPAQPAAEAIVTDGRQPSSADTSHANALAIAELCQLAGHPELTAAFLAEGIGEPQVRKALLLTRAEGPEIQSTLTPSAGNGPLTQTANPLLAAIKKLTGKE